MPDRARGTMAVVAGLGLVLLVGACGPTTQADPEATTTESVELDELVQAVADAADMLLAAPAVETGMVARGPDGQVDMLRWVARVDEDAFKYVRVRRTEGGEMSGSNETIPPGLEVNARVVTDDGSALVDQFPTDAGPRSWTHHAPEGRRVWERSVLSDNPLPLAAGDVLATSTTEDHDIDASVRRGADETVTWTATWEGENRTTTYSWTVAPDGHLSEHRREFAASPDETFTERARFEPQQNAPTITLPAEGSELDLDRFGVWPDLPRPTS